MRRLSLRTLLIGFNVGLVLATVVGVALAASTLLQSLADEQALARARLARAGARAVLEGEGADLLAEARLLAERPAVGGALDGGDPVALSSALERLQTVGRLAGCALLTKDGVRAASGAALPWERLAAGLGTGAAWSVLPPASEGAPLLLAAQVPVAGTAGARVLMARLVDRTFVERLGRQVGMPVALLSPDEAFAGPSEESALRGRAIDLMAPIAERLAGKGTYLAVEPLRSPKGDVVAVLEAALPPGDIRTTLRALRQSLATLAILAATAAAAASIVLGRRLARPLESLTRAAEGIGRGDLASPIPRVAGAEMAALAGTMEEMRTRLLETGAELRRRQAEAEGVLAGISEGVFEVDRERRIRYLSPRAAAMLDVAPGKAIGRFCGDVLRPRRPDGTRPCDDGCPIVDARFLGQARATEHLTLAPGRTRTVVVTSAAPAPGGGEGRDRQYQVLRDETEVEATRRLRDAVLAHITHEFRTPLSAQLASIELLRERLSTQAGAETRELLAALERGSLRLTQLIDNLLESVRLDAGQGAIRRQSVALDEVVEEAAALVAPLLDLRDQRLAMELPFPLPAIQGDAPRLVQVFVNLLANANKFAPHGSEIRVGGALEDGQVRLWVEDQGPGFPAEGGVLLFEPFMRSSGEEPEEVGIGLGLFIVKSIVERHGGRVEAGPARGAAAAPGAESRGASAAPEAATPEPASAARAGGGTRTGRGARICVLLPNGGDAR